MITNLRMQFGWNFLKHCLHTCCRILTNERLIAVNQDPLGVQGQCVKDCCSHESIGGGRMRSGGVEI